MELRQLTYVVAVADAGSFTAAARRCHVSQSALSTQVAQLENELSVRLFNRTTRRLAPTEAGLVFIAGARRLLADTATLRAQVSALTSVSRGTLRVGGTQTATRVLDLPALLGELRRRRPDVQITMIAGPGTELLDALAEESLDIALAGLVPIPAGSGLTARPLGPPEPLVAIVPAAMTGRKQSSITVPELAAAGPFIEFRTGTWLRTMVDSLFRDAGLDREIMFELGQLADITRCAMHGLGSAIVPRAFTVGIPPGDAAVLTIDGIAPTLRIAAYTRASRTEPLVDAALELLGSGAVLSHR